MKILTGAELTVGHTFKQYNEWFTIEEITKETQNTKEFKYTKAGFVNYGSFKKKTKFQIK